MFTGIVEECGRVTGIQPAEGGARLTIHASFAGNLGIGESVAANGACLTVTDIDAESGNFSFDLLAETLRVTNLGDLEAGDPVNLERALAIGDRLSGHFVQGHVDCTSKVLAYEREGPDHRLEIFLPAEFSRYVIRKGSICIDGISLTVADLADDRFTIWIIPHTAEVTNLGSRGQGSRVNLEFDLLAKYLERLGSAEAPVT